MVTSWEVLRRRPVSEGTSTEQEPAMVDVTDVTDVTDS
jgi:hypothetical protein